MKIVKKRDVLRKVNNLFGLGGGHTGEVLQHTGQETVKAILVVINGFEGKDCRFFVEAKELVQRKPKGVTEYLGFFQHQGCFATDAAVGTIGTDIQ